MKRKKMIAWLKALKTMQDKVQDPIDDKYATMQISGKKKKLIYVFILFSSRFRW